MYFESEKQWRWDKHLTSKHSQTWRISDLHLNSVVWALLPSGKHLHFSELPFFPSFSLSLKANLLLFSCNCAQFVHSPPTEAGASPCSLCLYHLSFSQTANPSFSWCQSNEVVISSPTKSWLGVNSRFLYLKTLHLCVESMFEYV